MLGLIGGGPTFVGTLVGQSFVNATLDMAFLALAGGSILFVITQLFHVADSIGRKDLLLWGLVAGLSCDVRSVCPDGTLWLWRSCLRGR